MQLRALIALAMLAPVCTWAAPTVFPTGTTIYEPDKTWNGFTVLSILDTPAVVVIDMNGRVVKEWSGFNLSSGGPARVLPGGIVVATEGAHPPHQEALALVQRDYDGRELWRFDRNVEIEHQDRGKIFSARVHHDWQRADFPAGYYSPQFTPRASGSNTLLLTHSTVDDAAVAGKTLEDDRLIEVDANGRVVWEWLASRHIDEFGFDPAARDAIKNGGSPRGNYDWLHLNSATYVGPNRWFDAGDGRFAPDNVIVSSRQANLLAIVGRDGSIAWQIGPNFARTPQEQALGQIIGQHHAHLIRPDCPARAICSCSTTAAPAATARPRRSRRTARASMREPRRACSRSTP